MVQGLSHCPGKPSSGLSCYLDAPSVDARVKELNKSHTLGSIRSDVVFFCLNIQVVVSFFLGSFLIHDDCSISRERDSIVTEEHLNSGISKDCPKRVEINYQS
jgi:hypothetical protein